MSFLFGLIQNIISNYQFIRSDFIGVSISLQGLSLFCIGLLLIISLLFILYCVGEKIRRRFFNFDYPRELKPFISIALGYILVGSGIALLGVFSLFYPIYIWGYILFIMILSLYPLDVLMEGKDDILFVFAKCGRSVKQHPWIHVAILGFILIGFLRLIPPETEVDALWYHTDYPRLYLETHTMMNIDPKGVFYPIVTPTLGDMYYILIQFFDMKDASRVLHYTFYILVILLYIVGFDRKKYQNYLYAGLLFVTAPVIIRHTSTAYGEFPWVLCWLLAILIITRAERIRNGEIILSAIFFGGTLATKLWMLPFYGVFIPYLYVVNRNLEKVKVIKLLFMFTFFSFLVPLLWYIRSYIITGNPLFPTFWTYPNGEPNFPSSLSSLNADGIRARILSLVSISPLSIFGLTFFLPAFFINFKSKKSRFIIFSIILTAVQLLINYSWHRFIIPFYSIIVVFLSAGTGAFISLSRYFKYIFVFAYMILFIYYLLNAFLLLPYGLGWADKNKYLTRVLSRDNSSYYDYGYRFGKLITASDIVATYGLWGFYYADFVHFYSEDSFRKTGRSIDILLKKGATKLLVKGGDIDWLCMKERLAGCREITYKLIASYLFPDVSASLYLYALSKN